MIAKLVTVNPLTSPSVEISKSIFSVGRNTNNDLVIQDIKVSQLHLTIELKESEFVLKDLSSNGTYVNNNKVGKGNSVKILNGDVLHLLPQSRIKPQEIVGFKFEIPEVVQVQKVEPINRQLSEEKIQQQPEPKKNEDNKNDTIIEPKVAQIVNEPPQKSQIIQQIEGLEEELECTVCNDYLFEAVSINPCNHHFCGACLSSWLKKGTQDCPNCRQKLTGIMVARTMNNLVEKWLKGNPQAKRTEGLMQKMKEENLIYKNPEKYQNFAVVQQQFKPNGFKAHVENYLSEDDLNYDEEEHDEEDDEEDDEYLSNGSFDDNNPGKKYQQPNLFGQNNGFGFAGGFVGGFGAQGLFGNQVQQNYGVPAYGIFQNPALACKSCNGKQWKGYQCPDNQVHVGCAACARKMPKRELTEDENQQLQMHCVICKAYHCSFYYGDCAQKQLQKFMLVEGLRHQMIIPVNFINYTEFTRLQKHLAGRPQVTIFNYMFEHYISKGYFYFEQNKSTYNFPLQEINVKITPKTPVCWLCHRKLINFIIFRYIQCIKYDEPIFQNPDCHYGINCRNQFRDQAHCAKYNHACEQIKFD